MNPMRRLLFPILSVGLVAGCSMTPPPADLDLRLTRPSAHELYIVSMRPLVAVPGINQIHAWEIGVTTRTGTPVTDAEITFSGGMPQHGHGYPTHPAVTANFGDGRYRLGGVKFSMSGWWEMKLNVQSAGGTDLVVFNTVVSPAATAQGQDGAR